MALGDPPVRGHARISETAKPSSSPRLTRAQMLKELTHLRTQLSRMSLTVATIETALLAEPVEALITQS